MSKSVKKPKTNINETLKKEYTFQPLTELLTFKTIDEYTSRKAWMEKIIDAENEILLTYLGESNEGLKVRIMELTEDLNAQYPEIVLIPLLKEKINAIKFALIMPTSSKKNKMFDETQITHYKYESIDSTITQLKEITKELNSTLYGRVVRVDDTTLRPILIKDVIHELASSVFKEELKERRRVYDSIDMSEIHSSDISETHHEPLPPGFFPESSYGKIFSVDIYTIHGPIAPFVEFLRYTTSSISNKEILKALLLALGKSQNKLLDPIYTGKKIKSEIYDILDSEYKLEFLNNLFKFKMASRSIPFLKELLCVELFKALKESHLTRAYYGKTMKKGDANSCQELVEPQPIFSDKNIMNKIRDLLNDETWPNGKHNEHNIFPEEKEDETMFYSSIASSQYAQHKISNEIMVSEHPSPDITLEEFISLFIDGWSSLFASYNNYPPLNQLLGYLVNTLNQENMLCFQKGGGGFSCYGQGKKVDFDAHLYYYGIDYNSLRTMIDGEFGILKQYLDAKNYFDNIFELNIRDYTLIIKYKETRIRHHTEKSTFPADLTSLDVLYDICVCKEGNLICCFTHTTAAFDLVVTSVESKDELKKKSQNYVYKRNAHCNILYLSELLRTIKDTFSDDVNFLNRINQGKINKDFERILKVLQVFKENGLSGSICDELENALRILQDIIKNNMSNSGLDMVEPTKESRKRLVEAMDEFSNEDGVKEINKIISDNIPSHKIILSKYRTSRDKEELIHSVRKGVEFFSKSKSVLHSLPPSSSKVKTQKKQPTQTKSADEGIESMKDALVKALSNISKKRKSRSGGKLTRNNKPKHGKSKIMRKTHKKKP
jgi:hypothetical protein